jgi:hypothetical protein
MSETDPGPNPSYSFRPSLVGGAWTFHLGEDDLYWDSGGETGRIPYDDITRVRLSYQPRSMQRHRFLTELRSQGGRKVSILSTSWRSISELERLDRPYHDFVVALHQRLGARGRPIEFIGGINPVKFWAALVLFGPLIAGIIGVAVRAYQQDAHVAALLIVAFLALFLFQGVNYFRRNRPLRYRPDAVPRELLPNAG